MKWTQAIFTDPDHGFALFRMQSILNAALASGSLTSALVNITAIVFLSALRRLLSQNRTACRWLACHG